MIQTKRPAAHIHARCVYWLVAATVSLAWATNCVCADAQPAPRVSGLDPALYTEVMPSSDVLQWKQVGIGQGGGCPFIKIHPADPNVVFETTDMGTSYMSMDGSRTYRSVRNSAVRTWATPELRGTSGPANPMTACSRPRIGAGHGRASVVRRS
jgi:hypothetical protein